MYFILRVHFNLSTDDLKNICIFVTTCNFETQVHSENINYLLKKCADIQLLAREMEFRSN